ncbi:hypothetical protein PTTG_08523 [Puccinia triticina 1-1 BBBD Race 1]|uniref:Uncharacterized protein n=1 Tax=Puccinia triticina (isolate 1-1 / race 1 (BBBD)) TaxID=630390 RepID=A0A180H125_PUCT1|nr:hypothetical protein PTTG_08523 [Puccinia triticina 1-1 BBBD Race 1]
MRLLGCGNVPPMPDRSRVGREVLSVEGERTAKNHHHHHHSKSTMNLSSKLCLIAILLLNLTRAYSAEALDSQNPKQDVEDRRRATARTETVTIENQLTNELDPTATPKSFLPQDAPSGFLLAAGKERETDRLGRENNSRSHLAPLAKDDRRLEHREESSKLVLNDSSDPLHLQSRRPKKKPRLLAPIRRFVAWLFVLCTTKNPIWTLSFKIFKGIFSIFFRSCRAVIGTLFGFLTHLMVWFWDEILFPMTFPIRLVFWLVVIKPLDLTKAMLKKLKPVILFLISAIGMGIFIGMIGSSTHLWIGDWLFPLQHKTDKQSKKDTSLIGRQKRREQSDRTAGDDRVDRSKDSHPKTENGRGIGDEGIMMEASDDSSPSVDADLSEEPDEDWTAFKLETELSSTLEPNQTRYTSAVQKLRSPSAASSSARQRHYQHHLSSDDEPSPSPASVLPDTLAHSHSDSVSILKHSPPPLNSYSSSSNRKKKVTFKTD